MATSSTKREKVARTELAQATKARSDGKHGEMPAASGASVALPALREFVTRYERTGAYTAPMVRNFQVALDAIAQCGAARSGKPLPTKRKQLGGLLNAQAQQTHWKRSTREEYLRRIWQLVEDMGKARENPGRAVVPRAASVAPRSSALVSAGGPIRHRFPLRGDLDFEVTVPRDLTTNEAERLSQWLHALAMENENDMES